MASDGREPRGGPDDDGVRVTRTRRAPIVVPGLLLLGVIGWLVARPTRSEPPAPPPPRADRPILHTPAAPPPSVPARDPELEARVQQRREERQEMKRREKEPPFELNAPGEHAGIAAFPPPGTKPIKRGIVVPDDYELPEGYIRHYQTTDDGRPLPPILMFHPDFAGVDADGRPVAVPPDRIVPPELAPPGLEPRTLDETTDVEERGGRRVHSDPAPPARR